MAAAPTVAALLAGSRLARLDAELLLAHVLGKDRAWLYAHGEHVPSDAQLRRWEDAAARRLAGEPAAYVTGLQEFFGRTFSVTKDVLIPRPATEGLVEKTLQMLKGECGDGVHPIDTGIVALTRAFGVPAVDGTLLDIGTGSGCIAVTLALALPHAKIVAVDVSEDALRVGRENAARHGVAERIDFVLDDGVGVIRSFTRPFVAVSNPPYIPAALSETLDVAKFEPHLALFAGPLGLDVLEPLAVAAARNPNCTGLTVECREDQVETLLKMMA